eukprot:7342926-Prymnesium_polylepis.1
MHDRALPRRGASCSGVERAHVGQSEAAACSLKRWLPMARMASRQPCEFGSLRSPPRPPRRIEASAAPCARSRR